MKNLLKLVGVIALAVVIGLTMIACGGGGGPGTGPGSSNIRAKITFANSHLGTNQHRSMNASRSVISSSEAFIDVGDTVLEDFYNGLGELKDSYTPTEFKLDNIYLVLYNNEDQLWVFSSARNDQLGRPTVIDFINPVIYEGEFFTPGNYTGIRFQYGTVKSIGTDINFPLNPSVTFTVPGGVGEGHPYANDVQKIIFFNNYEIPDWLWEIKVINETYSLAPNLIFPSGAYFQGITTANSPFLNSLSTIPYVLFFSNINKLYETNHEIPGQMDWIIDNLGFPEYFRGDIYPHSSLIVAPFGGITVPQNATAVLFTVHWDLENIIERYEGPSGSTDDDVYIIARDYYKRFAVTAEIEY